MFCAIPAANLNLILVISKYIYIYIYLDVRTRLRRASDYQTMHQCMNVRQWDAGSLS